MKKYDIFPVILILTTVSVALCADWPNWRGPRQNGSAQESNLPEALDFQNNLKWKTRMPGKGYSTPIVVKGHVFLTSMSGDSSAFLAMCLDVNGGKVLWEKEIGQDARRMPRNIIATPSPVSDGKKVYFLFGNGDLLATDFDGKIAWHRNLEREYGRFCLKYGYGSSPAYHDGKIFILVMRNPEQREASLDDKPKYSYLLAVNPENGENIWKTERKTDAIFESLDAYSTPILFDYGEKTHIINIGADFVTSHDPDSGRENWRYEYATEKIRNWRHIPSVVTGNGMIFGTISRGISLFALKTGNTSALSKEDVAWRFDGPTPDSTTPLYYNGFLYLLEGRKKILTCLDPKTGNVKWEGKLECRSPFYASPTASDGKIYCINEQGHFFCISAGQEFKILSEFNLDEKPTISTIAIADNKIFIRTAENLYCIGK